MTEDVPHGTRLLRPGDVPVTRVDCRWCLRAVAKSILWFVLT